jgi:protein-L-isoaspartate(D-aspartate) O-methyltransferase
MFLQPQALMSDPSLQRINMVESQVRASDVTDQRILRAMLEVPRELFAEPALRGLAYMDEDLPVAAPEKGRPARALLAPRTLAKLLQLAEIDSDARVLDVGCATGYSTAVLSKIAREVVAVEAEAALAARARSLLRELGIGNARVLEGPLAGGAPGEGPYDAIVVNGGVGQAPRRLLEQLKDGGRLVAVLADGVLGRGTVWHRAGSAFDARTGFEAGARQLPGFERSKGFVF